jgi:hypothetical protein
VTASFLDGVDPCKVERIFRHVKFTDSCGAQLGFGQELRVLVLHKSKQPIATSAVFFVCLLRELLLPALHDRHLRIDRAWLRKIVETIYPLLITAVVAASLTLLITAVVAASLLCRSSVRGHRPEIMFGVLVVVFCPDCVSG